MRSFDFEVSSTVDTHFPHVFGSQLKLKPRRTHEKQTMLRKSYLRAASFRMQHRQRYYMEEKTSHHDYATHHYMHPKELRKWYAVHETRAANTMLNKLAVTESENHNNGLSRDGDGAFEREMIRKGIEVEKYPLPTTVGVRRVHEMSLLRRAEIEKRSATAMAAQREAKKASFPSRWYDETMGPLNPHFLKVAQRSYSEPITELPREPYVWSQEKLAASSPSSDGDTAKAEAA